MSNVRMAFNKEWKKIMDTVTANCQFNVVRASRLFIYTRLLPTLLQENFKNTSRDENHNAKFGDETGKATEVKKQTKPISKSGGI